MSTRIELAKQLIEKAKELNDDGLLQMALDLLKEEPVPEKVIEKKKGRKKKAAEPAVEKLPPKIKSTESFIAPVRPDGAKAVPKKIVKDGKEYTLTKRESISLKQKFVDDGKTDKNDKVNKILKKYTVRTPRDRKNSSSYKEMSCTRCSRTENVPVILNYEDLDFLCTECTGRRMKENVS